VHNNKKNTTAKWNWHRLANWPPRAKSFPHDIWAPTMCGNSATKKKNGWKVRILSRATSHGCLEIHVSRLSSLFAFNDMNDHKWSRCFDVIVTSEVRCHRLRGLPPRNVLPHPTIEIIIVVDGLSFRRRCDIIVPEMHRFDSSEKLHA